MEFVREDRSTEDCDSDLCVTIDGWLIITPYVATEERPSIYDPIEFKTIHYEISKVTISPGSYYIPDSVDIVPIQRDIRSVTLAIEKAMHYLLDNDLNQVGEALAEKDMAKMEDEVVDEMDAAYARMSKEI